MARFSHPGRTILIALVLAFLVMQAVPYGRDHTNPPVTGEPPWADQAVRARFMEACGDCHSNETRWPWYSRVAPASWLLQSDVTEGRDHLNVSEWGRAHNHGGDAARMVTTGQMPPWAYGLVHTGSHFPTTADRDLFARSLVATFGSEEGRGRRRMDEEKDNH